jgi:FKBP-type peptidyl-prolyl cis-trans isomerase 2
LLPGFENAIIGMSVGQVKNITLSPTQAYGNYNPSLVRTSTIPQAQVPSWMTVGSRVVDSTTGESGLVKSITPVANSTNVTVVLDFNSPLAGDTLTFKLVLSSIQPA